MFFLMTFEPYEGASVERYPTLAEAQSRLEYYREYDDKQYIIVSGSIVEGNRVINGNRY